MQRLYTKLAKKATYFIVVLLATVLVVQPVFGMVPNDPRYADEKLFMEQINAEAAWEVSTGSKKIIVAFIDTGLDTWHEDLRDNLWVNSREIPDNGKDDDNNGYIDDINGWNFADKNNNVRPSVFDIDDDKEAVRHGTIVGGLIGGRGNNLLDGAGLSQKVSLMTLRAIKSSGSGSLRSVTEAVNYAVENGADIISMSFVGDTFEQRLYDAMYEGYKKGVVFVVAAGNYDSAEVNGDTGKKPTYPACFDTNDGSGENWFLTVGSVDNKDEISNFSEFGKCLDIMAPGEYIYSTERYAPQYGYPNQFGGPWFGTSFATPLVAATAALIKSVHPEYTPKEIIETILNTADSIDSVNPTRAGLLGRGRLNAGHALEAAAATPPRRARAGLWYFKNNSLQKIEIATGNNKQIAVLPQGKILGFTIYSPYLSEEVAVLTYRNKSYHLDVYKENGDFSGSKIITSNALVSENVQIKFVGPGFYLSSFKFNKKTDKTDYRVYDTLNSKITNRSFVGLSSNIDLDNSGSVFAIVQSGGQIKLIGAKKPIIIPNISKVLDFKTNLNNAVILAIRDRKVVSVSADLANGTFAVFTLDFSPKKAWKIKMLPVIGKAYYLLYTSEAGNYVIFDENFSGIQTIKLPEVSATAR